MLSAFKNCLLKEAASIMKIASDADDSFILFAQQLADCKGKLIFTGVGKSYLVGQKIASSFSSVGIVAFSIDCLSLLHGDIGNIHEDDILVVLSNSGETEELLKLVKYIQYLGIRVLSITGQKKSLLSYYSNQCLVIKTTEAGPFELIPSTSATAMMALGDALLCVIVLIKKITTHDFYRNHPEGTLSKNNLK